jgi:predicted DNA-binding transcriptional regulator AlpA
MNTKTPTESTSPTNTTAWQLREALKQKTELLREKDAAAYIDMSVSFLRKGRMEGARQGKTPPPPYLRLGRSIRYRVEDLDAWLEARKVSG